MASKNQRKGKPVSTGPFQIPRDMKLVIPLGEGHCYLLDPSNGKNLHLKLGSEKAALEFARVAALGHGPRIEKEVQALALRYPHPQWATAIAAVRVQEAQ
jgi:hypothetical protein